MAAPNSPRYGKGSPGSADTKHLFDYNCGVRYLLYITLPARLAKLIAALAKIHPGHLPPVPHITLVGPREIESVDRESQLVRALRATVRTFVPSPIAFDRIAYFGRKNYIYVVVRRTPWIAFWHKACERTVSRILKPSVYSWMRFHPHITLAAGLSEEEGDAVLQSLKARPFRGAFVCRQILLVRQNSPGVPWQLVARFRLAEKSPLGASSPPTLSAIPLPSSHRERRFDGW